jgi:peptidoglycan-associated lipoprotein
VRLGVDKARIKTISYGEEKPLDPSSNDAAWSKNRRGELVVQ